MWIPVAIFQPGPGWKGGLFCRWARRRMGATVRSNCCRRAIAKSFHHRGLYLTRWCRRRSKLATRRTRLPTSDSRAEASGTLSMFCLHRRTRLLFPGFHSVWRSHLLPRLSLDGSRLAPARRSCASGRRSSGAAQRRKYRCLPIRRLLGLESRSTRCTRAYRTPGDYPERSSWCKGLRSGKRRSCRLCRPRRRGRECFWLGHYRCGRAESMRCWRQRRRGRRCQC